MKSQPRIFIFAILVIAALSLAACDATGAVSIEELTGATGSNATMADTSSSSRNGASGDQTAMKNSSPSANLKLKGLVEEVSTNSLTVNGVTLTVDTTEDLTTYFEPGMAYELEYTLNNDDSISLISFSLDDSSDDDSYDESEFQFYGMLEDVTENTLTFNGETFTVDTTEDLTTLFVAGQFYEIEYYLNADGTITIKSYSLEDGDDEGEFQFYGILEDVTENTLTFNGETFTVDTTEDLTTLFTAGEFYEIEYYLNADGSITLVSYSLEDSMDDGDDSDDDMDDSNNDDSDDSEDNNDSYNDDNNDSYNDNNNNNDQNNDSNNDNSNNNDNENSNENND